LSELLTGLLSFLWTSVTVYTYCWLSELRTPSRCDSLTKRSQCTLTVGL